VTLLQYAFFAFAVSLDALVVSAAFGALIHKRRVHHAFRLAITLSFFHGLMPLLGWNAGRNFYNAIEAYDHWVVFLLLSLMGIKMLFEKTESDEGPRSHEEWIAIPQLLWLGLALSLDALVMGLTLSFLHEPIVGPVVALAVGVFLLSLFGSVVGYRLKFLSQRWLRIAGGLLLIALGVKTLCEHLLARSPQ
jgi:putative Mn2+ efflux pump MntP